MVIVVAGVVLQLRYELAPVQYVFADPIVADLLAVGLCEYRTICLPAMYLASKLCSELASEPASQPFS